MDGAEQESIERLTFPEFSIAVVGGGLVGALAALSVAKSLERSHAVKVNIHVFERYSSPTSDHYRAQYDARNLVLSSATADFFHSLGIWDALEAHLVPIDRLHVSRFNGRGRSQISAYDEGVAALGYVADMQSLAIKLSTLAGAHPNIQFHYDCQLESIQPIADGYCLDWHGGSGAYDLVMAADGENSWVCQRLGFRQQNRTYSQEALVTNISLEQPINGDAYERFTSSGAVTLLPLAQDGFERRMALVWIDQPGRLAQLQSLTEQGFLQQLASILPLDSAYIEKGVSKVYPLRYQVRDERVRPHLVLIGNAAQTLHPIAAQGFNLAVRDIRDFIQCMTQQLQAQNAQQFSFSGEFMRKFSTSRDKDVKRVRSFVDVLDQAFFKSSFPITRGLVQDLALFGFEAVPGAKAMLSRFAMGGRRRGSDAANFQL